MAVILVVLVLLAGITIKRFGMGAKGWEQIPLITVWRFIGNFFAVSLIENNWKFGIYRIV